MVELRSIGVVGTLIWYSISVFGQERPTGQRPVSAHVDSLRTKNFAAMSFDRIFDTYNWIGAGGYETNIGPLSFSLKERFHSTLVQTDRKRITDEQTVDLAGKYRFAPAISGVTKISSIAISDNQSIGITNVFSNAGYAGIEFRPVQTIFITPLIGMRYEKQSDQRDHGVSYALDLGTDKLTYEGYNTVAAGRFQYDKLSPRLNEIRMIGVHTEKLFFEQTRNLFTFSYTRNRRDFYSPADQTIANLFHITSNIESRTEDGVGASDTLDYNVGARFLLTFHGNVFSRTIDRETRYRIFSGNFSTVPIPNTTTEEMKIEGGIQARYDATYDLTLEARFFYQERDERHRIQQDDSISQTIFTSLSKIEESKNNHSRRALFSSRIMWRLSPSHVIALTGSSSLNRYDTPSVDNFDDHDELFYIVGLTTIHHLNRYLDVSISADVNLTHLVYLSSKRSANNTWNRIARLSPRVEYRPLSSISTVNIFEVLANYTAYDFEYPGSPIRSFAFRQFRFMDSTSIGVTNKLRLEFYSHFRFFERGEFQWDTFAERPLDYFEDKTFIDALVYTLNNRLLFSVGIRYFSESRFGYIGQERQLESILRSSGPLTSIVWHVSGRTDVSVIGWYEYQSQTGLSNRSFANLTMSLTVSL